MHELKLNKNHDLELKGNSIARFTSEQTQQRTSQLALCVMKTNEGEAFIDNTHGIPWTEKILGLAIQNLDVATRIIRKKMQEVDGIQKVVKVELQPNLRKRTMNGVVVLLNEQGKLARVEY